jgi:hypothetical protein
MEQVKAEIAQNPQKSEFVFGNEKMNKDENNETNPKTQGNLSDHIINQPQNTTKITKDNDGLRPTRQLNFQYATSLQRE